MVVTSGEAELSDNIDRTKADQIGMLATSYELHICIRDIQITVDLRLTILTPFECGSMTKLFSKDRANKYFDT